MQTGAPRPLQQPGLEQLLRLCGLDGADLGLVLGGGDAALPQQQLCEPQELPQRAQQRHHAHRPLQLHRHILLGRLSNLRQG